MTSATAKTKREFVIVDAETPLSERAQEYEEKLQGALNLWLKTAVQRPGTVPDAAAVAIHGPDFAKAWGVLADQDKRVRRAVEFVTQTENPYFAAVAATLPLVAQILRNHESETTYERPVEVKVPLIKRAFKLRLRWRMKLRNPFLRAMTVEPGDIAFAVFSSQEMVDKLTAQGVTIAWQGLMGHDRTPKA